MVRPFGSVVAIVIILLSLENTTRLLGQLENVEQPLAVLAQFMGFLLPEYLAIALIFALFIGISLSLRGLALSGEFDIFAAVGLSPARMLRIPLVIATLCALLLLLTRGYLEPWGERRLEEFGAAVRAGELGMAIKAGEFYSPSPHITFHADKIDAKARRFTDVLVRTDTFILFARGAEAVNGGRDGLLLVLNQGQLVIDHGSSKPEIVDFEEIRLPVKNFEDISDNPLSRRKSNRISIDQLFWAAVQIASSEDREAARSALAARFAAAFALPLLPFLAIGLSIPPKRQTGAIGIGLGILAVVTFVQAVHALEDSVSPTAPAIIGLIWLALATISFWSWHWHTRHGPGYIEGMLSRWFQPVFERLATLLSARRKYSRQNADVA